MTNDNKTPHMALEYDEKIRATIPNYGFLHSETIDLVKTINPAPQRWLDTGCGTGNFIMSAVGHFAGTRFVLADPSPEMLEIAKRKLLTLKDCPMEIIGPVPTQQISLPDRSLNVITAIQAHHYLDREGRRAATGNCFRMLKAGGLYVTFENIRPASEPGIRIGLQRWKNFQVLQGKSIEEAESHARRFDVEYLPITVAEHLKMLVDTGFSTVELFWFSYLQAGFYALK